MLKCKVISFFFFFKTRHLFHHLKNRGSMQSIWNSAWEIFLFSHNYLLNHLFILAQAHGYLFHILDYNTNATLFILLLKLFHWPLGILPLALVPLDKSHYYGYSFFSTSVLHRTVRCSQFIL